MRTAFSTATLSTTLSIVAASAALLASLPATAAGLVEVKYTEPEKFTDIGFASHERERNLSALSQSFERLAAGLPDGQTLKVEVLDVDLAGEPQIGAGRDMRIVRGTTDWPRMKLRYTLQAGNTPLKSGEGDLSDMSYSSTQRTLTQRDGSLPYEQRMLTRWFNETFSAAIP